MNAIEDRLEADPPAPSGAGSPLSCPSCGHRRVHRSKPRTAFERVMVKASPVRFYRCHRCMHRGWHLGPVSDGELRERAASADARRARRRVRGYWCAAGLLALASLTAAVMR